MKKNLYLELRKWKLFWGLTFDSQVEINKLLLQYNLLGYRCTHYQLGVFPNLSIIQSLLVIIVFCATLGFVQYWVGPTFLLEKEE